MDPDKIVETEQKQISCVYQSKGHPKHFGCEGDEFIDRTSNRTDYKNTMSDHIIRYPSGELKKEDEKE